MNSQRLRTLLPAAFLIAIGLLSLGVWFGLWATNWRLISGPSWANPSLDHWLGTNRIGQDIGARLAHSFASALEVGLIVAVCSAFLGSMIGAFAGFFRGRWVDEVLLWLTGCFESIPYYLLIAAVLFALNGLPGALQLAMVLGFWPAVARQARIRTIAIREQEFIAAGRVAGLTSLQLIRKHVLPHLNDLFLVQASLLFVAAIKTEVVLSFVGLAGTDSISFGRMLAEAGQGLLAGQYMNFLAASIGLFILIWSMNQLTDQMQLRLDPRRSSMPTVNPPKRQLEPV